MTTLLTAVTELLATAGTEGLIAIGAALAAFTGVGAGIGMGIATSKAVEAIARQPEAEKKIRSALMIGLAFAETTAIYGLFIGILLAIQIF